MSERNFLTAFDSAIASFEIKRSENGNKPDPEILGQDLVEILLSRPLGMDEQWFLASFFSGSIHKARKSGQPKVKPSSDIVQAVARHYIARVAAKHKKMAIYKEIEERFGLKRSTILAYLKMIGRDGWHDSGPSASLLKSCQEDVAEWESSK
jgi:hypothetical protein